MLALVRAVGNVKTHALRPDRDRRVTFCGRPFCGKGSNTVLEDVESGPPSCGRCRQLLYKYQRTAQA